MFPRLVGRDIVCDIVHGTMTISNTYNQQYIQSVIHTIFVSVFNWDVPKVCWDIVKAIHIPRKEEEGEFNHNPHY